MASRDVSQEFPGRHALRDYARSCAEKTREAFEAEHPEPILVQLNEGKKGEGAREKASGFATIVPDGPVAPPRKRDGIWVFEVKKRAGANAFGLMVTLGRTRNNDVVVPDPSVSKFHASFTKAADGGWLVTDMSSTGLRVDGEKVPREKPVTLRTRARLLLAERIELVFLLPGDAYDHMKRVAP